MADDSRSTGKPEGSRPRKGSAERDRANGGHEPAREHVERLRGRKLGDRRVRVERPEAEYFRYAARGTFVARPKAHEEVGTTRQALAWVRRLLFGRPLASDEELDERLPKKKALAIFSSDAISSSAYATEEILRALLLAGIGTAALGLALPVSIALAVLLGVVALSYRQIVVAYPNGGGAYSVARANFGRTPTLVAAASLLIGYVLTVAVSVSSASEQIVSALPGLAPYGVWIASGAVVLITLGNLRGLREAGNIFAVPTYVFLGMALLMIGLGAWQIIVLGAGASYPTLSDAAVDMTSLALVLLGLRAFSAGAVGLTGTEAIATGVPTFKPPEARNAAATLAVMAILLGSLFVGITFLADGFAVAPIESMTLVSQIAEIVFGEASLGFFLFLASTALLLMLAANTSFAAFPVLSAVLASDRFFPRQFTFRGDRLAYTSGIVVLALTAGILIVAFDGDTHALIPLYAVAIFLDFTVGQAGMVRHWLKVRSKGWRVGLVTNFVGGAITAVILVVVTISRAPDSLLVVVIVPVLVVVMWFIRHEYDSVGDELELRTEQVFEAPDKHHRVIVPVPGLTRAVIQSIQFGRSLSDDVRAVYITPDLEAAEQLRQRWETALPGVSLVIVETPYRSLVVPFLHYLDVMAPSSEDTITIVVLPEYVPRHWWDRLLYNQTANRLKRALVGRPDTVVADVPYRRERTPPRRS